MSIKNNTQEQISGAEILIRSLIEENVETIFGYPGGAIMPIYDALFDYTDKLKHYLVRHEQGGIHAAQGFARASGKVGVVFATSGPGATNLLTGIADAQIDSTPLVCITGQVAKVLLGSNAFQETDVIGISLPLTKWNCQVSRPEDIAEAIARAFYIAKSGRPGPVLVDITKNAQIEKAVYQYAKCKSIRSYHPVPTLNTTQIDEAVKLIDAAKKPYIFCGQGVLIANATQELKTFVEKTGIPVASTLLGLSAMPVHHPLYVGYLGMHGNYATNKKINDADVVIAVGMRFDDRVTGDLKRFIPNAKVIHIEIDRAEINKNVPATIAIHADAKTALQALNQKVKANKHDAWLNEFKELEKLEYTKIKVKEYHPETVQIKMAEVIKLVSDKSNQEAILVTDVGQHQMIATRYYEFKEPNTNITSGGLGTMGFCLPAAIGAKIGAPKKQVVAVIGDGGFQMTLQELGVIMAENVAVKIILLNNNFLGMVRQWQQLFFEKRYSFVELKNPDFIKLVDAYGIQTKKVVDRKDLSSSIDKLLQSENAYFLEVVVEKEENVFPMVQAGASVADVRLE